MRRFSLIGRLGPDDKRKVNLVQSDSGVFEIDFLEGDLRMGFGIGHALDQLASLGCNPRRKGLTSSSSPRSSTPETRESPVS